ncbi:MAG: 3-keto-5-aminohexanoate cleavage protein [Pseudomonadales bacterium]
MTEATMRPAPHKRHHVWLEVALNGALGKAMQPNMPVSVEAIVAEGIACAAAGAAIIHLHAYDDNAAPTENADIYARIIEGIRVRCDAIVYPTLALSGTLDERLAPLRSLAARDLLEWIVVDPGSVNIRHALQVQADIPGILYANPDDHIEAGLALASACNLRPAYAIYEPGFARLGAALASRHQQLAAPIYRVMFSDNLLFGSAPTIEALQFYASHLATNCPDAPWMISGLDANIEPIMPTALELGFHLRVGLEDAPLGSSATNVQLVEQAIAQITHAGKTPATPAQVRGH